MVIGPGYALVGWRLDDRRSERLRDPLRSRLMDRSELEFSLVLWVGILDTEEGEGGVCFGLVCGCGWLVASWGGSKELDGGDDKSGDWVGFLALLSDCWRSRAFFVLGDSCAGAKVDGGY